MDGSTINHDAQTPEIIEADVVNSVDSPQVQETPVEPSSEPIIETPTIPEPTEESIPEIPLVEEQPAPAPAPVTAPKETINTSNVTETEEVVADVPQSNTVVDPSGIEMITIRSDETGDKVYLKRGEKRYWIKNPETLAKLGFYLGKEKKLPFSELLQYAEGEPIDLTIPGFVLPWDRPVEEQTDKPVNIWR